MHVRPAPTPLSPCPHLLHLRYPVARVALDLRVVVALHVVGKQVVGVQQRQQQLPPLVRFLVALVGPEQRRQEGRADGELLPQLRLPR